MAGLNVRYATALFQLTLESGNIDEMLQQAVFLRDTLKDPDFRQLVSHPHISKAEKTSLFNEAFAGSIHEHLLGFISLAVAKDRESILVMALTNYIDMLNRHKMRTTAQVVSAMALSDSQIEKLKSTLSKKLGKQVDIALKVDPRMMGGFSVYVDGILVDRTIKKQFSELRNELKVV